MKTYRVFTNDRGKRRGVALYSCLKECKAKDAEAAARSVHPGYGMPEFAPIVALEWPATDLAAARWLKKHVGD